MKSLKKEKTQITGINSKEQYCPKGNCKGFHNTSKNFINTCNRFLHSPFTIWYKIYHTGWRNNAAAPPSPAKKESSSSHAFKTALVSLMP